MWFITQLNTMMAYLTDNWYLEMNINETIINHQHKKLIDCNSITSHICMQAQPNANHCNHTVFTACIFNQYVRNQFNRVSFFIVFCQLDLLSYKVLAAIGQQRECAIQKHDCRLFMDLIKMFFVYYKFTKPVITMFIKIYINVNCRENYDLTIDDLKRLINYFLLPSHLIRQGMFPIFTLKLIQRCKTTLIKTNA